MRSVVGERDLRRNALAVEADPGFPPHHHCRKGVESLKALVSRSGFPGLWEGLLQNWSLSRLHPSGVPCIARCRSDVKIVGRNLYRTKRCLLVQPKPT